MKDFKLFNQKFRISELNVFQSFFWVWSVRPWQPTLGAGILSLKRYANSFSDITNQEGEDLAKIIKVIERVLKRELNYDKLNYLMLMMVDHHVHFHIIPRYSREIIFAGVKWKDIGWPGHPNISGGEVKDETLFEIQKRLVRRVNSK